MGLLQKLWDDMLAGPAPETGLSKLRRYHSFSPSSSASSISSPSTPISSPRAAITTSHVDDVPISRSITILRSATSRNSSADSNSTPSSPASCTSSSGSPFSRSPAASKGEMKRLTRRKSTLEALERAEPRSPTVYDWVVISALDR